MLIVISFIIISNFLFINISSTFIEKVEIIKEFDVDLFLKLIEKMTVFKGRKIIVSLLDCIEIEVVIE